MPETAKGRKIHAAMRRQYGPNKGDRVFYASINKGTITGADRKTRRGRRSRRR